MACEGEERRHVVLPSETKPVNQERAKKIHCMHVFNQLSRGLSQANPRGVVVSQNIKRRIVYVLDGAAAARPPKPEIPDRQSPGRVIGAS